MPARFRPFDERRKCSEDVREHTAELLHRATKKHAPHVGAALGVGKQRIQNMVTAECANPLELLKRWLDELELRGVDPDRLDDIAREVASWRHCELATVPAMPGALGVVNATALAVREIGEALYAALAREKSSTEKLRQVNEAIEALRGVALACEREHLAVVRAMPA